MEEKLVVNLMVASDALVLWNRLHGGFTSDVYKYNKYWFYQ